MRMQFNRRLFVAGAMFISVAGAAQAGGLSDWTEGHGDIGIAYEDGWNLHIHAEGATIGGVEYLDDEFGTDEVRIVVPGFTQTLRPVGAEWSPIGVLSGEPFWILSQSEAVGAPFVGFGTEEILAGDFVGDQLNLTLTNVVSPSGLGHFSVFQTDLFGAPTFFASSTDGLDGNDALTLNADDHFHANIAFSEVGEWLITFEASGVHAVDGFVTGEGTYTFNVLPEPTTAGLFLVGGLLAIRRRVR